MEINKEKTNLNNHSTSSESGKTVLSKTEIETTLSKNFISLDDYFLLRPEIKKPVGFDNFWKGFMKKLKNKKKKDYIELLSKGLISKTIFYNIALESLDSYLLKANFILILKHKKNPAVLYLENYENDKQENFNSELTKIGVSQFFLFMRNPEFFFSKQIEKNLNDRDNFFLTNLYHDSFYSLKFLSKFEGIDKKNIILSGKGIGSSSAIFSAVHFPNTKGLILDEIDVGFISKETFKLKVNWMMNIQESLKDQFFDTENFLSTLKFFDILHFVQKIKIPTLLFLQYDKENPQKSKQIFAFFNYLKCDKRIKVFVHENKEDIEEKKKIKINFIKELFKIS